MSRQKFLSISGNTPFGRHLRKYFQLDPAFTSINHGSYGAPPRVVVQALRHYEDRMERCPDVWMDFECEAHASRVIDDLRKFVNVSDSTIDGEGVGDLVLVQNCSFAMNSVLRSWPWKRGDKLFLLSEAYRMTKATARYLADTIGITVVETPVTFPIADDALIDLVTAQLKKHGDGIKLAVFSHVTSMPAAIFPVKRLVDLCRSMNVACVLDGAHALGQMDVDLTALDPDFYISNGHKWLMSARGTAFLYAKKKWRKYLHSAVTTVGYGQQDARKEFYWQGTRDYSAWYTISTAIKFRAQLGENRIRNYCRDLSLEAGELMALIWKTQVLITDENQLGSMNNVRLPLDDLKLSEIESEKFAKQLVKDLYLQYNTFLQIYSQNGVWYTRISAQIYNDIDDFRMVAEAVLKVRDKMLVEWRILQRILCHAINHY